MRAWDREITIDAPQDMRGTFSKPITATVRALLEHVKKNTSIAESRVLASGILSIIEEMEYHTGPIRKRRHGNLAALFGGDDD